MADDTLGQTIPEIFTRVAARGSEIPALGFIRDGVLHWRTWRELADDVDSLVSFVQAAGIKHGDRVAQVSENRYEWIVTDLALHLAGAVHVPIHVTLSGQQIAAQITHSGARLVFVSSAELLAKFADLVDGQLPIVMHDAADRLETVAQVAPEDSLPAPPDDLATILYTSGTTGQPRGVMLSGRSLASNAATMARMLTFEEDEVRLCFLPLSHIYARTCDLYLWLCRGTRIVLAEQTDTVMRDCQLARPTSIRAVPYFYQKLAGRIRAAAVEDAQGALRQALGGEIRHCFCGGAALDHETSEWFAEQGLPVFCGYGLTEAAPVVTASALDSYRQGTVGRPLDDVEVRLADDGEILVRGPNVMLGYWRDQAASSAAIRDGWLYTGDLGHWDDAGFLVVDGRKSETIVLSTGKKISPAQLEAMLLASPLVEQVMVVGDGHSQLGALVVPQREVLQQAIGQPVPAGGQFSPEFLAMTDVRAILAEEIASRLSTAARHEQVRSFVLLGRPFCVERGELTPKRSLCREVITRNFTALIDDMYAATARSGMAGVQS